MGSKYSPVCVHIKMLVILMDYNFNVPQFLAIVSNSVEMLGTEVTSGGTVFKKTPECSEKSSP